MSKSVLDAGLRHCTSRACHLLPLSCLLDHPYKYDTFSCYCAIFIPLNKMPPSYYPSLSLLAPFSECLVCSIREFFICFSKRTLKGSIIRLKKGRKFTWKISVSFSLHMVSHHCLSLHLTASWLPLISQFPFSHHSDR